MHLVDVAGYVAAVLVFLTFYMKTMIPLRLVGICSNCVFITYAYLGGLHPVFVLHLILLPLNSLRLREMLRHSQHADVWLDLIDPFRAARDDTQL